MISTKYPQFNIYHYRVRPHTYLLLGYVKVLSSVGILQHYISKNGIRGEIRGTVFNFSTSHSLQSLCVNSFRNKNPLDHKNQTDFSGTIVECCTFFIMSSALSRLKPRYGHFWGSSSSRSTLALRLLWCSIVHGNDSPLQFPWHLPQPRQVELESLAK